MFRITIAYNHPENPDAFLAHYRSVHAPLTATMPGISSFEWGVSETLDGSTPAHFVVGNLNFPSKDEAIAALGSPEGKAGGEDMANFAGAGFVMDMHEVEVA
ncbi:EthD family reductase [Rhodococcus sp. IEGM 1381]|uniref:EthD family reductase n=1 Tax=Rhodococcus sp. IEGM 1381 TaxID=3047085 RepID=UPI0024B73B56|nr:EthD family reductase [Rhodococcus sp. IEGM 1381]MDI9896169.1 EthD family reductase [Rhodococcus sp. IEGM 1381]